MSATPVSPTYTVADPNVRSAAQHRRQRDNHDVSGRHGRRRHALVDKVPGCVCMQNTFIAFQVCSQGTFKVGGSTATGDVFEAAITVARVNTLSVSDNLALKQAKELNSDRYGMDVLTLTLRY